MQASKEQIVVGLDIGTTKICAIVGRKNEHGKLEILGIGKSESHGVMRGVVANIEKTVDAIQKAVAEAEQKSGVKIKKVFAGIAGQHIRSMKHRHIITLDDYNVEVNRKDIQRMMDDVQRIKMQPGERIIHALPQEFTVDSEAGIKDPIGMCGSRLEANFHIITGQIAAAQNIEKCILKAGLEMSGMILEPIASSASVLSEQEKEAGVCLVDIGGGTTDVAIFYDGIIRHTAVIPFGGNIITEDIREGCRVLKDQAEALKTRYGSALSMHMSENDVITIPGIKGLPSKEISMKNLANIIQARVEEIIDQVFFEIRASGYSKKLIAGIVLTGGGAHLKHLKHLVEYRTGIDARVGLPIEHVASAREMLIKHPMFATSIGLVLNGFYEEAYQNEIEKQQEKVEETPIVPMAEEPKPERIMVVKNENWSKRFFGNVSNRIEKFLLENNETKDFE